VLSEFERRLLDDHVTDCEDCRAFVTGVAWTAEQLRAAPREQPRGAVWYRAPARSRFRFLGHAYLHAAAGIAATVALAAFVSFRSETDHPVPVRPAIVIDATSIESHTEEIEFLHQLRDYRNAQNANESDLARERRPGFLVG